MKDSHLTEDEFGLLLEGGKQSDHHVYLCHLALCPVCYAVGECLLIWSSGLPRAAGMLRQDPPAQSSPPRPLFYWSGRTDLGITVGEDCSICLPEIILWAFGLGEGDLLAVSQSGTEDSRYHFESFSRAVRFMGEAISHPWPYLQELLLSPMAALGPQGKLCLPEEAAILNVRPGESLRLVVMPPPYPYGFTLESTQKESSNHLALEIKYVLPVEKGYVRMPADLCAIAGLDEDKFLAYSNWMGTLDFSVFGPNEDLAGRDLASLGPERLLRLPESFLADLKPGWRVLLCACLDPEPRFRLTYSLGGEYLTLTGTLPS